MQSHANERLRSTDHEYGFKIEDFKWNKEKYGDMREKLLEIAEEYPVAGWLHLEGDVFPDGITTAPITDVVKFTAPCASPTRESHHASIDDWAQATIQMKEGFDEAKWAEVINFAMDDVRTAKGFHNGCWAVSKGGQTYVVAGWDSVEVSVCVNNAVQKETDSLAGS